jgi:hypothetical protein
MNSGRYCAVSYFRFPIPCQVMYPPKANMQTETIRNPKRARMDLFEANSVRAPLVLEYKFPVTAATKNVIPADRHMNA